MSVTLHLSFDGPSIALSFVVGISVLFGVEIMNVTYHHWRSGKPWSFCMRSLPIWAFLLEIAPFGLYAAHQNNAAILILGYALSLLFAIFFYCSRLISKLSAERTAIARLNNLKSIEQERMDRVSSISVISSPSSPKVSSPRRSTEVESQSSSESMSSPKPKARKNGVYWMLVLNRQMDKKPVGYMSCNMHGFCYVNCKESKKSSFEIIWSGQESDHIELYGFWKCSSNGTRTKRKICVKTQGHWTGYVGMWSNDDPFYYKVKSVQTLAMNGYKISYWLNGKLQGWLGYDEKSKWGKIVDEEENAAVYILGRIGDIYCA